MDEVLPSYLLCSFTLPEIYKKDILQIFCFTTKWIILIFSLQCPSKRLQVYTKLCQDTV